MTNTELKEALQSGRPVVVKIPRQEVMNFSCVSAVVYRRDANGGIRVSAEVIDRNQHSVIVVEPKHVEYA